LFDAPEGFRILIQSLGASPVEQGLLADSFGENRLPKLGGGQISVQGEGFSLKLGLDFVRPNGQTLDYGNRFGGIGRRSGPTAGQEKPRDQSKLERGQARAPLR